MSFKKSKRPQNARKRPAEDEGPTSATLESSVIKAAKKAEINPLIQATASFKAKRQRTEADSDDDSADVNDYVVSYSSKREVNAAEKAQHEREKEGIEEPEIRTGDDAALITESVLAKKDDGLYHGAKNYKSKLPTGSAKYGAVAGPSNIRTVTITDYQPDVCKDYKETGFCGFGDTCKFLHDRGDYLQGWQLDNIYLSQRPTATAPEAPPSDDEEDKLPFACLICRKPFTDPIVTRCGHYFCSSCAITRFAKTPKCFACGQPTGGLFNKADKIFKKREMAEEAKRKAELEEMGGEEFVTGELDGIEGIDHEEVIEDAPESDSRDEESGSEREFEEDE